MCRALDLYRCLLMCHAYATCRVHNVLISSYALGCARPKHWLVLLLLGAHQVTRELLPYVQGT